MCLIALAWKMHPRYRLALIANRDEAHARPTAAAGFDPEAPDVFGGRDLQAGGSWLLASTRGRIAAVTNVRAGLAIETTQRSRGALVHAFALGTQSSAGYLAALAGHACEYGRFNLIVYDGETLSYATNHPVFQTHAVGPGVHAMSNGAFDAPWPKSGQATRALTHWLQLQHSASNSDPVDAEPLFKALRETTQAPDAQLPDTGVGLELERALSPPFVLGESYGTRCSTVVLVGDSDIRFIERRFGADGIPSGESEALLHRNPGLL